MVVSIIVDKRHQKQAFIKYFEHIQHFSLIAQLKFEDESLHIVQTDSENFACLMGTCSTFMKISGCDDLCKCIFIPDFVTKYKEAFSLFNTITINFLDNKIVFRASFGTNPKTIECKYHGQDRQFYDIDYDTPPSHYVCQLASISFAQLIDSFCIFSAPCSGVMTLFNKVETGNLNLVLQNEYLGKAKVKIQFHEYDSTNKIIQKSLFSYNKKIFITFIQRIRQLITTAKVIQLELSDKGVRLRIANKHTTTVVFMSDLHSVDLQSYI